MLLRDEMMLSAGVAEPLLRMLLVDRVEEENADDVENEGEGGDNCNDNDPLNSDDIATASATLGVVRSMTAILPSTPVPSCIPNDCSCGATELPTDTSVVD